MTRIFLLKTCQIHDQTVRLADEKLEDGIG
jgi:hypothetical protein